MLLQYDNLRRLDTGRNLITFPIQVQNKIWGVLNIEDLPFIKYNQYTERLLFIIISLIEPSLQKAVEYEAMVQKEEFDPVTGLPLFTSFYKVLSEEIRRKSFDQGKLSIIILEIVNFNSLASSYGRVAVQKMIPDLIQAINRASGQTGQPFEYKEDSQIAFIFPNLDYDGASLYCLEILGILNSPDWKVKDQPVMLEAVIGYSSLNRGQSADELIDVAENLLDMQKV
jgi:PleD family two-component response regulator